MASVETENKLSRLSRRVCCINTRVTELENQEPASIDEYPTEDSSNAVSSGGVFSKFTTVDLQLADKADLVSGKVPLSQLPDDIQDLTGVGYTGTAINFADLPDPTLHSGEFFYVTNSQGTAWLFGTLGGSYRKAGTYYSNGTAWVTDVNPFQAQQADVNAGVITDQFVSPYTLANASSVVHTTGTETITGAKTFNNSVTIAQKMISTEISSATIPGMILEVGNGSWANQQAAFSFRKNGSQIFGIDGLGQLILSGSMTMSNTTPESGTAFVGHGMRRVSTTAGFNFAWGESIASTTEPGLDLFPISGTHITNGILLRLSKDSGKTDVALQVNGDGNVGIGTTTPNERVSVKGKMEFQNAGTVPADNSSMVLETAPDIANPATTAFYMYPRDTTAHRLFLGTSTRQWYSLNLTNVQRWEGVIPPFQATVQVGVQNTSAFHVKADNTTGSNAHHSITASPSWNTTGSPSLLYSNIVNTASGAASRIFNMNVDGGLIHSLDLAGNGYYKNSVLIGTTTLAGYSLDVNGTARATKLITSSTGSVGNVDIYSSNVGTNTGVLFNSGLASVGLVSQGTEVLRARSNGLYVSGFITALTGSSTVIVSPTNANVALYIEGVANGDFQLNPLQSGSMPRNIVLNNTGANVLVGTATDVPSSKFTVASTTKGSIPFPLMTSAQRTAIASPAIGLHVYQTDGTEGVYVNKSTGWAFAY